MSYSQLHHQIDFFTHQEAGKSHEAHADFLHHFTYGTHYIPTRLGRSTLRRADHIKLRHSYAYIAQRDIIFGVYVSDKMSLILNHEMRFDLNPEQYEIVIIPEGTHIHLETTLPEMDCFMFECDLLTPPERICKYDPENHDTQTTILSQNINKEDALRLNDANKPLCVFVLKGHVTYQDHTLHPFEGLYSNQYIRISGDAKILIFDLPIPL